MKHLYLKGIILTLMMMVGISTVYAQQKTKFAIASFGQDPFDQTATNSLFEKTDGSGARYAIIKVTSTNPEDDLRAYRFNFGQLNSLVEEHDGQLWVYVQRNAKLVTISREGYQTIDKYDLGLTIEPGKTYKLQLRPNAPVIYSQMVMFNVHPANSQAIIMIRADKDGAAEEMLGAIDETGAMARSMPYGTYTYKVVASGYHTSEGRITLNDLNNTHVEEVTLKANFSEVTLHVNSDADIYVNNELKGRRSWTGRLKAGNYQVECRQENHRSSSQVIQVMENDTRTIELPLPTPILGMLSILSKPLGASITIDGKDYGKTPRNIYDIIVGRHKVAVNKDNYDEESQEVYVQEGQTTNVNLTLRYTGIPSVTQTSNSVQNTVLPETVKQQESIAQTMHPKASKKPKKIRAAGLVTGSAMILGGALMMGILSNTHESFGSTDIGVSASLIAVGVTTIPTCLIIAHKIKKKESQMSVQSASLYQQDYKFKNRSSLSPSINLMKDQTQRNATLGVGLSYNF